MHGCTCWVQHSSDSAPPPEAGSQGELDESLGAPHFGFGLKNICEAWGDCISFHPFQIEQKFARGVYNYWKQLAQTHSPITFCLFIYLFLGNQPQNMPRPSRLHSWKPEGIPMDAQDHWHFHLGYSTSMPGTLLVAGASRIWPKASPIVRIWGVWVNLLQNPTFEGLSAVALVTQSCRAPDDAISGNEHLGLPQHLLPEGLSRFGRSNQCSWQPPVLQEGMCLLWVRGK